MRETIETAVEAELYRRFDAEPHPLQPKFAAAAFYEPLIGWCLRLVMQVNDYGGRIREASLGITKQFLEAGAQKLVGPRPPALLDWLAPFAGEQTYDKKIHAAGIKLCGEMAEHHFRDVLKGEVKRRETQVTR